MKYLVSANITISLTTEVEAKNPAEARKLAMQQPLCTLTDPDRQGEDAENYWVHSGELDGEPEITEVEIMHDGEDR